MSFHLEEATRQIRGHTIELLKSTPPDWLLWAPTGTSNHILWHAGHAVWLQDVLGIQPITGETELPAGWADTFGSDCRPVRETENWPEPSEVQERLQRQFGRLLEIFRSHSDRLSREHIAARVVHGLHDEARHQGEMYLLVKMCRAQNVPPSGRVK